MHFFSFTSSNSQVLFLIYNSYKSWSTRFISLKMAVGFFIFHSVSFLLKFIFLITKMCWLFYFNIKATHSFAPTNFENFSNFENSRISAWDGAPQKLIKRQTFWTYRPPSHKTVFLGVQEVFLLKIWEFRRTLRNFEILGEIIAKQLHI